MGVTFKGHAIGSAHVSQAGEKAQDSRNTRPSS